MKRYVLDARTATPHFPGIGRYVSNLAQQLPLLLHENERVVLLQQPGSPALAEGIEVAREAAGPFSLRQQMSVPRSLRRPKATVYHSPYYLMPYRPGVPTVLTVYDLIPLKLPGSVSARARLLFRLTTRLALAAADRVIVVSAATQRDLLAAFNIDPRRVSVIPLAADPQFRPATAADIAAVRARYNLPDRFLLYLGINKPHKGLGYLIDGYTQSGVDLQLIVAGAWDPRYPEVAKQIAQHDLGQRVRLIGPVAAADLPALYSAATLFVFPSLYEGFGLPPLEALACGTPVACADSASLPEVVGDAAYLFRAGSAAAIAEALAELVAAPARLADLAARGPVQAARFSWASTAEQTLAIYRSVV